MRFTHIVVFTLVSKVFAGSHVLPKPFSPLDAPARHFSSLDLVSEHVAAALAQNVADKKHRILVENPCTLCADGSNYTIEGTLPPTKDGSVTTCAQAAEILPLIEANDPTCVIFQLGGRHCGCPIIAPEGACSVCFDGTPVDADAIVDVTAFELTGLDVNMKDIGLPDGSGDAVSCGELETNLHVMSVVGGLGDSDASNVNVKKEEGYDEAMEFVCSFFQNFAGPQCGCPPDPDAEFCVACPFGVLEPNKVTNLSGQSLTCEEAHELIKIIPPGELCDQVKTMPPPGCSCSPRHEGPGTSPEIMGAHDVDTSNSSRTFISWLGLVAVYTVTALAAAM